MRIILMKGRHPVFQISFNKYLIGNLMEQDEEAEGEGNKENGKEGEDGEEGQQHL